MLNEINPSSDGVYNVARVNWELVRRLGKIWHKKASVKKPELDYRLDSTADRPDFPLHLVPFHDHPLFVNASEDVRAKVLSWGWIAYNERTITAEEKVANPAFQLILNNAVPGVEESETKLAVAQSIVDEQYHTLMHTRAILLTKEMRGLPRATLPFSITYRTYLKCLSEVHSDWERNIITVLFATVSEISINAFLSLLSSNQEIQPLHRLITFHHDADEVMHMLLLEEIAKNIFVRMSAAEKKVFLRWLPVALQSFVATDFSSWESILTLCGFKEATAMIEDVRGLASRQNLVRDYQGLERLVQQLGIGNAINFDFGVARGGRKTEIVPEQMIIGD